MMRLERQTTAKLSTKCGASGTPGRLNSMSAAREYWLWHSFREVPGVWDGALIAVFVIMLAVPS